ncbi:MAG: precorrin-6A/cobalt-precorrin-6A reductase, partial [Geminicoccaceae bacterium]
IRTIEPVARGPLPPQAHCMTARGPFDESAEVALLERHRIDALVTKASGGDATYAKIAAARRQGLPVIMIQRPPLPTGPLAHDTNAALAWLRQVTAQARGLRT